MRGVGGSQMIGIICCTKYLNYTACASAPTVLLQVVNSLGGTYSKFVKEFCC